MTEEAQQFSYTQRIGHHQDSFYAFSKIAYQCLVQSQSERPTLEAVIRSLKRLHFQVQNLDRLKIALADIRKATNNFNEEFCIGSGGYGKVYKCSLEIKTKSKDEHPNIPNPVAIKRIFRKDIQGQEGFFTELDMLSRNQHPNIISLLGFCVEDNEMLLVYEHAVNGSLDDCLKKMNKVNNLTWIQRLKMCIDIANGLHFLHTTMEDKERIIHRDIKSANVLLGENWEAKIADFGLSKFHPQNQGASTMNTKTIAGTSVYLDPEYARTGRLKKASDIYSFGVVLFEIFSGKLAYDSTYTWEDRNGLAPIARKHFKERTLNVLIDPKITDEAHELISTLKVGPNRDSVDAFSRIAIQCLKETQAARPTIEEVIMELKEALKIQEYRKDTLKMSLKDITFGENNFSDENCIIAGGYGMLYEGEVHYINGHKKVYVKQFQGSDQELYFLREFEVLFKHRHENIIGLVGYCKELDEKLIVYEHASNGCLSWYLSDISLSWSTRLKICIDIAKGMKFLHGGDVGKEEVIHRNIKSSNILLTEDWKAKICGFELSQTFLPNQKTKYATTDVVGSPGYCDPLYRKTCKVTRESDVYSLGVILFQILGGRLACPEDELIKGYYQVARLDDIVFEGIKEQIVPESLAVFRTIAFQCLHEKREERPTAGEVVVHLQKSLEFQEASEIWEAKLPKNYKDILRFSKSHEMYSRMQKKDIYNMLFKGVLLQDDKLWFSISEYGERNEMVTARMFSFKNRWSCRWRSIQESRFPKVAEMSDISNLNIQIKIRPQILPSDVKYSVNLVFKFCSPRKSKNQRMYVNLKYKMRNDNFISERKTQTHSKSTSLVRGGTTHGLDTNEPKALGKNENLHAYFATLRSDGWMMIELCRFSNLKKHTNFEFLLEGFSQCYCDSRAIYIEGLEFQTIDNNVKQEKMKRLNKTRQVLTSLTAMTRVLYHKKIAEAVVYNFSDLIVFDPEPSAPSRFDQIYEVPRRSVLYIKWHIIECPMVPPNTECLCYLVFKLSENCPGLHCPVIVRDQFHRKPKEIIYFRPPSPHNIHDTDQLPRKRRDGWMEVIVSKFNSDYVLKKGCLLGKLKLVSYEGTMSGLVISGLKFRSIVE